MLAHYFMLATKVLLRRKFFTFISLFGISFTLMVLILATAILDHMLAPQPPETRQDRTLQLENARMWGPRSVTAGGAGFELLDRYARDLPGVERLSLFTGNGTVDSYVNGRKIQSSLKRTDAEFWRILEFTFIEGAPYSTADVTEVRFVAIINRTTRQRFFGNEPALGRSLEAADQRFRVIGVVDDVSEFRSIPFADIWVPYTTAKSDQYRKGLGGNFRGIVLATDRSALPLIREEFNSRLARIDFADFPGFTAIAAPFETKFGAYARNLLGDPQDPSDQSWKLVVLFWAVGLAFVLLPVVNLVNISISRILERQSEVGVRKAFGASSSALVGQFIVETVLLTLAGGVIGLGLSLLVLDALNGSGAMGRYAQATLNLRVFGYGVLLALAFGLLSGVYPAWRMSRLHPVDALRQGGSR